MLDVKTKDNCYDLYQKGFFGNKALTWKNVDELLESCWNGKVCIRSRKGIARGDVKYGVPVDEVKNAINEFKQKGISEEELSFNELMPDDYLIIQGEIMQTTKGICILCSDVKKQMNIGLKERSWHVFGLKANHLLKYYLDASSYEDVFILFEIFPNAIIEFSSYDINVCCISGRNTVIWEVRES